MGPPQPIPIPVNCSLSDSVTNVLKCGNPSSCKIHPSGTCGTAQFSTVSMYTVSVTVLSWKKNCQLALHWLIHVTFSILGCPIHILSYHENSKTTQLQQLWWFTLRDMNIGLITDAYISYCAITVTVYSRQNAGDKVIAMQQVIICAF